MSIRKFDLVHEGGEFSVGGVRTYNREYRATSDNPRDGEIQIWSLPACPQIGDRHPRDNLCFVKSVKPERESNSKFHWKVAVDYSSERDPDEDEEDPTQIPAKISMQSEFVNREAIVDRDGKPLLNTAGDLLRGIEVEDVRWVFSVKKNVSFVPQWALDIPGVLNDSVTRLRGLDFAPDKLRITGMSVGDEQLHGNVIYSEVELQITFDKRGWTRTALNQGFTELRRENVGGKKFVFRDRIMIGSPPEPPSDPLFLDLTGKRPRDAKGKVKETLDPQDIVILQFNLYEQYQFSSLNVLK